MPARIGYFKIDPLTDTEEAGVARIAEALWDAKEGHLKFYSEHFKDGFLDSQDEKILVVRDTPLGFILVEKAGGTTDPKELLPLARLFEEQEYSAACYSNRPVIALESPGSYLCSLKDPDMLVKIAEESAHAALRTVDWLTDDSGFPEGYEEEGTYGALFSALSKQCRPGGKYFASEFRAAVGACAREPVFPATQLKGACSYLESLIYWGTLARQREYILANIAEHLGGFAVSSFYQKNGLSEPAGLVAGTSSDIAGWAFRQKAPENLNWLVLKCCEIASGADSGAAGPATYQES